MQFGVQWGAERDHFHACSRGPLREDPVRTHASLRYRHGIASNHIISCCTWVCERGYDIARTAWIGLPDSVPGVSVALQCSSSVHALQLPVHVIARAAYDLTVASALSK
jgi:acetyl-CoA acetyltransferase